MTALNLLQIEDRHQIEGRQSLPEPSPRQAISISMARWKTRHANVHLLERFSTERRFRLQSD